MLAHKSRKGIMAAAKQGMRITKTIELIFYTACLAGSWALYTYYGEHPITTLIYFIGLIGITALGVRVLSARLKVRQFKQYSLRNANRASQYSKITDTAYWRLFKVLYIVLSALAVIISVNTEDIGLWVVGGILLAGYFIIKRAAVYIVYGKAGNDKKADMS